MKRGAEHQLTKTDSDAKENEDSDDSSPGQGFQKAPEIVLATRKIKPLPSRAGSVGAPKPLFGGFGGPSPANVFPSDSTSSPISSTTTSPQTSVPPSSSGLFAKPFDRSHDATPSAPFSVTPASSPFSIPSVSSTGLGATNTSKAFASIINTSNLFASTVSNPAFATTAPSSSKASNGTTESSLTKYYTDLRGLNVSLSNFINNTVDSDPFTDLTKALESYKTHRSQIQKEFDESSRKETTNPSASAASPLGDFGTKSTSNTLSTSDSKSFSGSVFGSSSNLSTNPFGALKPANASDSSSPAVPGKSSSYTFSSPAVTSSFGNVSKPSSTSPAFSIPPSSDTAFGMPKPSNTDEATSVESSSVFGSSTTAFQPAKLPFSFGTGPNPFGPPATIFGSPSTTAIGTSADTDKKPTPSIAFGSPSPVAKNMGVFYGFGTGSRSSPIPTSIGVSDQESRETSIQDGMAETGSQGSEPKDFLPGLLTPNPHDEEGAGEENEVTVHAVKLKAYRMKKADEQGGSGWAELGMGVLRLKKDKDTGSRRMLLRNSTNGKININFKIYPGLKPSISKKALTFVGHSGGDSQTYCVRLPGEEQANELKAALEREIEFIKAEESS